jgi:hypothetical protein
MYRTLFVAGLCLLTGLVIQAPVRAADDKDTAPKVVRFDELKRAITDQKGKVLVVDIWSDT